jgi:glycosyltransferase involved in cell wall biosynthesis
MTATEPHVLIVVQNLPVPLDRRVWLECQALVAAGYHVSVICPKGPGDPGYAELNGVRIWKYRPPPRVSGPLGYAYEFGYCWLRTAWLAVRVWRRERFDALQACNPPDTYWALGRLFRYRGVRFVYDQHDLNPEVFRSRFGEPRGLASRLQYGMLRWLERQTYRAADHVIATNESYRRIALTRGGRRPEDVTVVRSGPNTDRMRPVRGRPELRRGRQQLAVYLGIMGPQDGVELVLRALAVLVHQQGRDLHVALLGFGDCYDELVELAHTLDLDEHVTFTGRADLRMITEYLSTADIGLSPDPQSPLNDVSTMNKTMEYMSFALPVVAFDLAETRVSARDAAVYVKSTGDVADDAERYAIAIAELLDDPDRRTTMGVAARLRATAELDWVPQSDRYVSVYGRLLGAPARYGPVDARWPEVERRGGAGGSGGAVGGRWPRDEWGNELVDLRDRNALRRYVVDRGLPAADPATAGPVPAEPAAKSAAERLADPARPVTAAQLPAEPAAEPGEPAAERPADPADPAADVAEWLADGAVDGAVADAVAEVADRDGPASDRGPHADG